MVAALAVLYPGLHHQARLSVYAFKPELYTVMTLVVGVFTLIVGGVLYYATFRRDLRRSAGVAAVITLALFSWPQLTALGVRVALAINIRFLADVVPVVVVAVAMWVAVGYANRDRFVLVLLAGLTVVLVATGLSLPARSDRGPELPIPVSADGDEPTVVVLVLDGYARADVLASLYGFDNSTFLDALSERGFRIRPDALANYSVTHASLPSMLDLGYPFETGEPLEAQAGLMRRLLSGDGSIMRLFDSAGYDTVMFENAWSGSQCGGVPDRCHRTGIVGRSMWALGQLSPFASIQSALVPNPFVAVSLRHIRELGEVIEQDASAPLFVLAHATIPHPPIQLSAACDPVLAPERNAYLLSPFGSSEGDWPRARVQYIDQLRCVNGEVIATVDRLIAADDDVEIVIVADHGPDSQGQFLEAAWSDSQLVERMAVLSAVRMPEQCDQPEPALTTVNTLRRAVDCALGTDLVELPDRSFTAPPMGALDEPVLEVTGRLDSISSAPAS
jgi:hypothetical protein